MAFFAEYMGFICQYGTNALENTSRTKYLYDEVTQRIYAMPKSRALSIETAAARRWFHRHLSCMSFKCPAPAGPTASIVRLY